MPIKDETTLLRAVEQSWNATTTYNRYFHPDSEERKRLGQSGPTALVVQDFLGGTILSETVILPTGERTTHYSNVVGDEPLDPTRSQYDFYPDGVEFKGDVAVVERASFDRDHPITKLYDVLRMHVELNLPQQ